MAIAAAIEKTGQNVGTRRNSCLFIVERISNNTDPLTPNPGLTLAGGSARIDTDNDTVGRLRVSRRAIAPLSPTLPHQGGGS